MSFLFHILFHFFQCCSEFLSFHSTQGVKQMWKYHRVPRLNIGLWFSDWDGRNNVKITMVMPVYGAKGRRWATWQIPDAGRGHRDTLPSRVCRGTQRTHWPQLHWDGVGNMPSWLELSTRSVPLFFFSMHRGGKFCSVIFYLFMRPLSVSIQ